MGNALDRDLREGDIVITHRLGAFVCRSGPGMRDGIADGSAIFGVWLDGEEPGRIDGIMDIDVDATDRALPTLVKAPTRPQRGPTTRTRRSRPNVVDTMPDGAGWGALAD
jgi:hypothetical protein